MNAIARTNNVFSLDDLRPVSDNRRQRSVERRHEPRYVCQERLFVQIVACPDQPDLVGRTESGQAVEISAMGIHFCCERLFPVGTLVDIWVDIASRPGKFFLSGEVRWNGSLDGMKHSAGVELEDGPATDVDAWRALFR
ncbi:MAG: hypothetical protein EA417_06095 [Gammaproteobacteria bacterium]|nr:MAG: hypothetical protein EA417_06095 [Gammaproteobacteria bacterium]